MLERDGLLANREAAAAARGEASALRTALDDAESHVTALGDECLQLQVGVYI